METSVDLTGLELFIEHSIIFEVTLAGYST